MSSDQSKYAVVDKISEGWATILIENEPGQRISKVVTTSALPGEAKEGDWVSVEEDGGFKLAPDITLARRDRIKSKLAKLRNKTD